jgi:hypothetical protein
MVDKLYEKEYDRSLTFCSLRTPCLSDGVYPLLKRGGAVNDSARLLLTTVFACDSETSKEDSEEVTDIYSEETDDDVLSTKLFLLFRFFILIFLPFPFPFPSSSNTIPLFETEST